MATHHQLHKGQPKDEFNREFYKTTCAKCGATRQDQQIGLEETPETYVQKLVEVFREVKRVLKDDGTLWLNLGDSYANLNWSYGKDKRFETQINIESEKKKFGRGIADKNLPSKSLMGIPWRVAFALQADGWILRQDIIWHKPNPMPESVTDRCTKAHEYIFILAKSQKYYFDNEAIKEPHTTKPTKLRDRRNERYGRAFLSPLGAGLRTGYGENGRNKRSVWTITTKPFKGAHFATFPEDLVKPCILAGSPKGGVVLDPFCGSGTVGVVCQKLGRDFIGIELNPDYVKMAEKRIAKEERLFQ
jgi:DNA modification methylase